MFLDIETLQKQYHLVPVSNSAVKMLHYFYLR